MSRVRLVLALLGSFALVGCDADRAIYRVTIDAPIETVWNTLVPYSFRISFLCLLLGEKLDAGQSILITSSLKLQRLSLNRITYRIIHWAATAQSEGKS